MNHYKTRISFYFLKTKAMQSLGMRAVFHNRFRWSRRKLTLLSKVLYPLVLLMAEGLVHAFIHVHNFIWHRSRQQGLPILAEPDGSAHPRSKKSPCIDRRRGASHSTLLLFYTGCITAQSGEGFWKLTSRRTPAAGTNLG